MQVDQSGSAVESDQRFPKFAENDTRMGIALEEEMYSEVEARFSDVVMVPGGPDWRESVRAGDSLPQRAPGWQRDEWRQAFERLMVERLTPFVRSG